MAADRLYFKQLLAGRDIGKTNPLARQMMNFVYLIGDLDTREAMVIDPAYDIQGILDILAADEMTLTGVLVTHYHPDHVGGDIFGHSIEGVSKLLETTSVPVHTQEAEAHGVIRVTGTSVTDIVEHQGGDIVKVGDIPIELLHTPGHTPGSQSFLLDGMLVSGDTLFLEGCGRVDLPGGDAEALYHSVNTTLAKVPNETILYPGHLYAPEPSAPMGDVRQNNYVFRFKTLEQWVQMFNQ